MFAPTCNCLNVQGSVNDILSQPTTLTKTSALESRSWNDFENVISNIENVSKQDLPLSLTPPHNSFNDDLIFELEDFSTDTTANLSLDSDSSESDGSDSESETSSIHFPNVSRSMPINFSHSPLHETVDDHVVEHIDINDIHNSMQMLAQSVTDPYYRDLPRPGRYQRTADHI